MERLLKKGYEVIYLTEPVDEYCIQALPEFDGKRFQNVAKEGVKFDESEKAKEKRETLEKDFEPLTTWLKDKALKDKVRRSHCYSSYWEASSVFLLTRCCVSDREGHLVSEADQLALRSGRQPVRLVGKHGEDHEGTGLPDRKRHLHKVSYRPGVYLLKTSTEQSGTLANSATVASLQLLRQPEENVRNQPQTPPHQADACKSQRKSERCFEKSPVFMNLEPNCTVSFFRRTQRTRRQKIWPWFCLRRLR